MSHRTTVSALLTAALAIGLPLWAADPAPVPPAPDPPCTAGSTPGSILRLTELAENGRNYGLLFGAEPQDVDVNSRIRIEVCKDNFARWIDTIPSLKTAETSEISFLLDSSAQLRKASTFLRSAIEDGTRLANLLAERGTAARTTPEFTALAAGNLDQQIESRKVVNEYWRLLNASPRADFQAHAKESREKSNAALGNGRFAYAAFLVDEMSWTLDQLQGARDRLAARPPSAALVLAAARLQDGKLTDVGLENYSSLPIGEAQRIDKVSLVSSPEEMQQLAAVQKEYTALAAVFNDMLSGKAKLDDSIRKLLAARGIDLDKLAADLAKVKADIAQLQANDWKKVADDLTSRLETALQETLTQAEKQILDQKLRAQIDDLRARARELQTGAAGLAGQIQILTAQIKEGAASDPAAALSSLLSLAQVGTGLAGGGDLLAQLAAGITTADQLAKTVKADAAAIRQTLAGVKATLQQQLLATLSATATDQLGQLSSDLAALRTAAQEAADQIQSLFKDSAGAVNLAAVLDREPPVTSFSVPFDQIQNTWLDLQTLAGRKEGDTVVLQAWLYRIERVPDKPDQVIRKEELVRVDQPFRMMRFGFYSGPAAGLVYLRAAEKLDGQTEETRAFAPQVSWLLHYRPWRKAAPDGQAAEPYRAATSWRDDLAVGLHTMSLDLDKDNQQEIGFGLSLSLFGGYLQIGGGFDLSLGEKPYFFIGTKLFDLLRNPGVKTKSP